jgi:hypothetical protein
VNGYRSLKARGAHEIKDRLDKSSTQEFALQPIGHYLSRCLSLPFQYLSMNTYILAPFHVALRETVRGAQHADDKKTDIYYTAGHDGLIRRLPERHQL